MEGLDLRDVMFIWKIKKMNEEDDKYEIPERRQTPIDCRKDNYVVFMEETMDLVCNNPRDCMYKDDKCDGKCRCMKIW